MSRNVLFVTLDQWRGDCLSAAGHPVLETPALDALAAGGVLFTNHWANAAPCGPSRACLYTGTYLHHNRSVHNGTPLDARFTNMALLARQAGYQPALFGYTDTSVDPRTVGETDPRLFTYEGVLPGFDAVVLDPYEQGSPAWGRWLAARGVSVPANPHDLYQPMENFPGADQHGSTWAPARFGPEHSQSVFIVEEVIRWLDEHGGEPFFVHASFIRPHPPRRNPPGYHDLYDADDVAPFLGAPTRDEERKLHPFNAVVMDMPGVAAPEDERERRQIRATYYGAQREVDDQLARLIAYVQDTSLGASTLIVVTSDHGDMACDHWLLEKLGYWDESFHVPLVVVDPDADADAGRGSVVGAPTESVDVLPTICDWIGVEVPGQADGWSLAPFLRGEPPPTHWRSEAHFEWDFSNPRTRAAERYFGIPSSHCWLAAARSPSKKFVQFAASADVLPPLLFDLDDDPMQVSDRAADPAAMGDLYDAAQAMLQWRMRYDDPTLSTSILDPRHGLMTTRDDWR